jgi:hypothetical protein
VNQLPFSRGYAYKLLAIGALESVLVQPPGSKKGVSLFALNEGRRTHYEVSTPSCTWSFNLLFPAISKFDRITRKGEQP